MEKVEFGNIMLITFSLCLTAVVSRSGSSASLTYAFVNFYFCLPLVPL